MKSLSNKVQLIGHIGNDPETRTFTSGKSLVTFSLATNDYYKDNNGERVQNTQWHDIVVWGEQGNVLCNLCRKGSRIAVSGRLTYRSYQDTAGNNRKKTEIVLSEFVLLDVKQKSTEALAV